MAAGSILHVVGSRFMTDMGGLRKKMRKTYAFMWAAGLGLMGAPFITTGFWSKDAILLLSTNQEMSGRYQFSS